MQTLYIYWPIRVKFGMKHRQVMWNLADSGAGWVALWLWGQMQEHTRHCSADVTRWLTRRADTVKPPLGQAAKLSCASSWLFHSAGATVNVPAVRYRWYIDSTAGTLTVPLAVSNSVTSFCSPSHQSLLRKVTNVSKAFNCNSVFESSPMCEKTFGCWFIQNSLSSL